MGIALLVLILIGVFTPTVSPKTCTNKLQCFKTELFNFVSPKQAIYQLDDITNKNDSKFINVMAYGDFNNDLHTDFVDKTNDTLLSVYIWDKSTSKFNFFVQVNSTICPISNVFLYDLNFDGLLDIVVWGNISEQQNCLLPFSQTVNKGQTVFIIGQVMTMNSTTNPFVISYGENNNIKEVGLLTFMNGQRTILVYSQKQNGFKSKPWLQVFPNGTNYSSIPFANPHWNGYLDLTGDCRGDVVIIDEEMNVQFWVNDKRVFYLSNVKMNLGENLIGFTFNDMNYDGLVDMIVAYRTNISIHFNTRKLLSQTDFCIDRYRSITFNLISITVLTFKQKTLKNLGALQIKDINIDGYPDLMLAFTLFGNKSESVEIYISNSQGRGFGVSDDYRLQIGMIDGVISVSFIDFMENGIMDFMVCTKEKTYAFYNNRFQQNFYFIKGYGASGKNQDSSKNSQIVGASFYWINSVGDGYRTEFQAQIVQTAYNALQTPFAYCGIGRANNYVQSFTLGVFGQSSSWSPIIPNSQLAVYAPDGNIKNWTIRIFVLPEQSLIYVIVISSFILLILGVVLLGLKFRNYRKKKEPLMEFIY